jgi:hypothetical protein
MSYYISLSDLIHDSKNKHNSRVHLTLGERDSIVALIGKGCRKDTKERLWRRLSLPLSLLQDHGIYRRLVITDNGCDYTCGQSWGDEMRTLRECLIKN